MGHYLDMFLEMSKLDDKILYDPSLKEDPIMQLDIALCFMDGMILYSEKAYIKYLCSKFSNRVIKRAI